MPVNLARLPFVENNLFRWMQLAMGIVCMAMIANLQYGWTLFVDPIDAKFHWGRAAIQLAFTLFVVTETWLVPIEAWFVDKYGPRIVIMFGGVMIALAWILNSYADTLVLLYVAAIIGGVGAGAVYGTCVGNALKWFPDRCGLAAGATAAGFGAGAALTVVPIASMIASSGYQSAFFIFGIGQGLIVFILAFFLCPPSVAMPAKKKQLNLPQTKIDFTPPQVLRSPIFWIMYVVFVMPCYQISAKRQNKRQPSINVASNAPPKSPVCSSQNEVVSHINIRSPRRQPGKFVIGETKRLLQHYLLPKDGVIGRPSLWIAEDFGCCASG